MMGKHHVLVLCTGNSCRSILAEVLLRDLGGPHIESYSAGSQPAGTVHPGAIGKLQAEGHSTDGLTSKSWDAFSGPGAPSIDLVITVCDSAAGESCPLWSGGPVVVHWGIPDPARAPADAADAAFELAYGQLRRRAEALLALPLEQLSRDDLREQLQQIHTQALAAETGDV